MTFFTIDEFKGKGVVVTGASSGIGAAVARAFARNGAHVAVHYNAGREAAEALTLEISQAGGVAYPVYADFNQPHTAKSMLLEAHQRLGRVDILINNAGALAGRHRFGLG